jgi:hemerythrin
MTMDEFVDIIFKRVQGANYETIRGSLLIDMLNRWLFNHIRNDDMAYAPVLKAKILTGNAAMPQTGEDLFFQLSLWT